MDSLSIFFPAYNEEGNIKSTVNEALRVARESPFKKFEILVINDGSYDNTGKVADKLADHQPEVKVIHHKHNRGYGGALKSGFSSAKYDWVVFTDSDGQFKFSEINSFLPYAEHYDAIIGYRLRRQDNFLRRLNGFAWTLAMKMMFGLHVKDINCGFKMIRRSALKHLPSLQSDGAFISTELIVGLVNNEAKIKEVGVHHFPRLKGQSTGANLGVIKKAFSEMWRLRKSLS